MPAEIARRDPRLPYREISDDFLEPRDPLLGYIKVGGRSPTIRYSRAGKPWVGPIRLLDPARFEICTREKRTQKMKGEGAKSGEEFTVDLGYVRDDDFHAKDGVGPKPSSLRIRLLYPRWNQNLISFLGAYGGREWVCRGNGVEATDIKRGACVCPCPRLVQFSGTYEGEKPNDGVKYKTGNVWKQDGVHPCKPHGQLNVLLEDAGVFGGFWALKTTSYGTISNLIKSLQMFEEMFGRVDGLPLELRVMAVTMQVPGGGTTVQPQVTLVLPASMDGARQIAADAAAESRKYLPAGGPLDETKYLEAVVSEMEEEGEAYAREFMPAEVIEDEEGTPNQENENDDDDNDGREGDKRAGRMDEGDPRRPRGSAGDAGGALSTEGGGEDHGEGGGGEGQNGGSVRGDDPEAVGDSGESPAEEGKDGPLEGNESTQMAPDERPTDAPTLQGQPADSGESPEMSDDSDESPEDSGRNDPEPKSAEHELAAKVLKAAGWKEEAIQGRLEYHEQTGTLDKLLERLERGEPDAWAKVEQADIFEDEPEDGLGS
ncbi:MAG: hypothetical protein QGD93_02660 [Actinomycetota bacterium]|nr:hypothetical protein [Actinomycetota bacterium]